MGTDGLQQEAFAGAVSTHQKAEACPAVGDEGEVGEEGLDLDFTANGDIGKAYTCLLYTSRCV